MQTESVGEYCLAFTDDKTINYEWIYILKHKDEVSSCFLEWKTLVEKSLKQKVKALRADNGDGNKVIQNPQTGDVWISQEAYARKGLQKFGMENAKPIDIRVDASSKLVKTTQGCEGVDQSQFQSAV